MKRIFDFTVALAGMTVLLPVFALLALLVFMQDRKPVFFTQPRVGKGGKDFTLFKFRSMSMVHPDNHPSFEPGNTSRVTAVGRFLRKTKLDELPQLWNVVKGDMSLVGPRPEVRKWVDVYPFRWAKVLSVRPGITDVASIVFRHEETILAASENPELTYKDIILPHKLELYEKYVDSHSFAGDLLLILKTLYTLIGN